MKLLYCDPGHSGLDSGALGPGGTQEKDINLQVGLRMRQKLQGVPGLSVLMTRETDTFVSLSRRAQMANEAGADLFLSLHCNSAKNFAEGFEAFTSHGHTDSDIAARYLINAYAHKFPNRINRGAKEAGFAVLTQTRMDAVLFEMEFIHTPSGEAFLTDSVNQDSIADALCEGVMDHFGLEREPVEPPDDGNLELLRNAMSMLSALEKRLILESRDDLVRRINKRNQILMEHAQCCPTCGKPTS